MNRYQGSPGGGFDIAVDDHSGFDWSEHPEANELLEQLPAVIDKVLGGEGVPGGALHLDFVDVDTMAELNQTHMGHEGPTDVLSFPLDGSDGEDGLEPGVLPRHIGDVIVCPAVALDQAADHTGSFRAELTLLVVHGVLHLLGHDHADPEETLAMQGVERRHLIRLGHRHPADG